MFALELTRILIIHILILHLALQVKEIDKQLFVLFSTPATYLPLQLTLVTPLENGEAKNCNNIYFFFNVNHPRWSDSIVGTHILYRYHK